MKIIRTGTVNISSETVIVLFWDFNNKTKTYHACIKNKNNNIKKIKIKTKIKNKKLKT